MRADLNAIYSERVTVVTKLDARDGGTKYDTYWAHGFDGCMWSERAVRSVQADGTVTVGVTHQVQIPDAPGLSARTGDYVVRGTVEAEGLTLGEVRDLLSEREAFQIQALRNLAKPVGFSRGGGIERFADALYLEG